MTYSLTFLWGYLGYLWSKLSGFAAATLRVVSCPDWSLLQLLSVAIACGIGGALLPDASFIDVVTTWHGWEVIGIVLLAVVPLGILDVIGLSRHWRVFSVDRWSDAWDSAYELGKKHGYADAREEREERDQATS